MPRNIRRRTVLKAIAAISLQGLTGSALPRLAQARDLEPVSRFSLQHALYALFPNRNQARTVGRRCLECLPGISTGAIQRTYRLLDPCRGDPSLIALAVQHQRTVDFAAAKSVMLDGWIIAGCEADLCAAAFLLLDT